MRRNGREDRAARLLAANPAKAIYGKARERKGGRGGFLGLLTAPNRYSALAFPTRDGVSSLETSPDHVHGPTLTFDGGSQLPELGAVSKMPILEYLLGLRDLCSVQTDH